jgi:hypothetical protein
MCCVSTVRYAVKVNGELSAPFIPTRGLRQGDPISPYLFLLCAEGLSSLLKKKEHSGWMEGVRNGVTGLAILHLLFADDSIFFARADMRSINTLKLVLQTYSEGSGQKINLHKSSLFFGNNCPEVIRQRVMDSLDVHKVTLQNTYLSMPTYVGQSRVIVFSFTSDALFVWLINHQPAVLFSQNKPATSNQPTVLFSQNKSAPAISHQPNEQGEYVEKNTRLE